MRWRFSCLVAVAILWTVHGDLVTSQNNNVLKPQPRSKHRGSSVRKIKKTKLADARNQTSVRKSPFHSDIGSVDVIENIFTFNDVNKNKIIANSPPYREDEHEVRRSVDSESTNPQSILVDDQIQYIEHSEESLDREKRTLYFGQHQQYRPRPQRPDRRFFFGDQNKCSEGTCEFFLFCWLKGGYMEGGCGGFLFACCQRQRSINSGSSRGENINYGPVVNDEYCGSTTNRATAQRRIVGGSDAGFGVFPWQAYVRIGSSRCGGSLVNRNHVVTAGHCVARATSSQVLVTLGDYILNSNAEPLRHNVYRVKRIAVHPKFKFTPQADRYDVAVLTLRDDVPYEPHISPICLPSKGEDYLGETGWVAGWGALQPGSRLRPKTLQVVDVPVIDNETCERWHRGKHIKLIIHDEMMCAGYKNGGKDSCQGDSGGPLMAQRYGRWYLIGLVSAGYSCAQNAQPGIYHRIAHTADWISHEVQKD